MRRGSGSTNRSRPTPPPRPLTGRRAGHRRRGRRRPATTTWLGSPAAPASSAAPRSVWPSAHVRGPATRRCRIAISTPAGDRRVRRVVFLTGPMGRSRAALTAAATCSRRFARREATSDPAGWTRSAARGRHQPVEVGDDDPVALEPDAGPSSLNCPSSLFTLWRVQPTIEARSAWVRLARRRKAAVVIGGSRPRRPDGRGARPGGR